MTMTISFSNNKELITINHSELGENAMTKADFKKAKDLSKRNRPLGDIINRMPGFLKPYPHGNSKIQVVAWTPENIIELQQLLRSC